MTDVTVETAAVAPAVVPVAAEATPPDVSTATSETETQEQKLEKAIAEHFGDKKKAEEKPADKPEDGVEKAEKTEETAAEPPKTPEQERVGLRIAAARKAELRAKELRDQVAAEKRQLDAQRAEMEALKAKYERLKSGDPLEVLDALGADKLDFVKRVAQAPEVVDPVQAHVARLEAQLQAQAEALAAERAEREAVIIQQRQQQYQVGITEAQKAFVESVTANESAYPNLVAEFTPAEIARQAVEAFQAHNAEWLRRFGKPLEDSDVAAYLEELAAARAAELAPRRKGLGASKAAVPVVNAGAPSHASGKTSTMTNAAPSGRAAPPRELTQEEKEREMIRIIEAERAKKR